MLIPEIDKLLEADQENVFKIKRLLSEFSPDLPTTINHAAELYTTCARVFGQGIDNHFDGIFRGFNDFGVTNLNGLKEKVEGVIPPGQEAIFKSCKKELDDFISREIRGMLLVKIGIWYSIAISDFLRMRLFTPLACIRLQCESFGLIKIMTDKPEVAVKWKEIDDQKISKIFYRKYQPRIKEILRSHYLEFPYDYASNIALHSRFVGIVFGLREKVVTERDHHIHEIKILAQEIDPENPDLFIMIILFALRVQDRIIDGLSRIVREINDPILIETRIPRFRNMVDNLFKKMARRRPDLIEKYKQELKESH